MIALVVRTQRPFFKSRPGAVLLWSTLALIVVALAIPYLPSIHLIGFVPLNASVLATLCAITIMYVLATEAAKGPLFRWADQIRVRTHANAGQRWMRSRASDCVRTPAIVAKTSWSPSGRFGTTRLN